MGKGTLLSAIGIARRFTPWLLLLALLLRGMIPGGYMPNMNPDNGKGWLVICTSAGSASIQVDGDGGDDNAPADTGHQGLCPFMAMTLLGPVLLLLALLLPAALDTLILRPFTGTLRRRLLCGPTLGARAPPLSWAY